MITLYKEKRIALVATVTMLFFSVFFFSSAWTGPTGEPPTNNTSIDTTVQYIDSDNNTAIVQPTSTGLPNITSGQYNTAFGLSALNNVTDGLRNVGVGSNALYSNSSGDYNVAVGYSALTNNTASQNTAVGYSALTNNTASQYNTAVGYKALVNNTGQSNTATGRTALYSNTSGEYNVAVGTDALFDNTTNDWNTAVGYATLANSYGYSNTGVGQLALYNQTSGDSNTGIGRIALYGNTTGNNNTALGYWAGYANSTNRNTTGSNNVFIGYKAAPVSGGLTNAIAIGSEAIVDGSNKVVIGNSSVTAIGGYANWSNYSDARLKKNVVDSDLGLDFILKLRPVVYEYDLEGQGGVSHNGLIAQEVEKALDGEGGSFSGLVKPQSDDGYYELRYAEFVTPLINAVQEQQALLEKQQDTIDSLKKRIQALEENL